MKILIINTSDKGGAANSCIRLQQALLVQGVDVKLLFLTRTKELKRSSIFSVKVMESFLVRAQKKVLKWVQSANQGLDPLIIYRSTRPKGLEYCSFPFSDYDITLTEEYKEADIIHLHWVAGFLDWNSFFSKNSKPIVWTLHDENPYLGAEHYAERYLGISDFGFPIKREYSEFEVSKESELIQIKKNAIKLAHNLTVICPSQWLLKRSNSSEILGRFNHGLIPYGFPLEIFRNYHKGFARDFLGLDSKSTVILFVADSLMNERKGFVYLQRAYMELGKSRFNDVQLCAIGGNSGLQSSDNIIELGNISDERILALAYSAADVFVIPSLEDNLPNTMIEALLCGTPVIGFPTGGIQETITTGENGILCDDISVKALYDALNLFLSGNIQFDTEIISKVAREKYSSDKQANEYNRLYIEIFNRHVAL